VCAKVERVTAAKRIQTRYAQRLQPRQARQAGRDAATELVVAQITAYAKVGE
jgi:uncharacterized protein YciW